MRSEKKEELIEKEVDSEKNEELRKKEKDCEKNSSDGQVFSCQEITLISNDSNNFSLSSGVEHILQDQDPCDFTSPLRTRKQIGLIPSAPLVVKPTILSNPQETEQGVVTLFDSSVVVVPNDLHENLIHMKNSSDLHVNVHTLTNSFSHDDLHNKDVLNMHKSSPDFDCNSTWNNSKQAECAMGRELETNGSNCDFMLKYKLYYLDQYGFLKGVWHVDHGGFLYDEYDSLLEWLACLRLVFDPGGLIRFCAVESFSTFFF